MYYLTFFLIFKYRDQVLRAHAKDNAQLAILKELEAMKHLQVSTAPFITSCTELILMKIPYLGQLFCLC